MDNKKTKKILVTGGAGFIGINSVRVFADKGWHVTVLDNFSRGGTRENINSAVEDLGSENIDIVEADIVTDKETVESEVQKADAVLHLAAQVAVTTSIEDPVHDFESNLIGTFNILEAIRKGENNPFLIFSSTNKVYGALEDYKVVEKEGRRYEFEDSNLSKYGVSETENLDFHSPYGCSKGAADQYVIDYSRIYDLKTTVFRQSCIYGPHQFGIEAQGWVAWFSIAAMLEEDITIYGTGKQVRDILHINDLTRLYEKAILNPGKVSGNAYNIGGGPQKTLSLLELISILNDKLDVQIEPEYSDIRSGDQPIYVSDIRKIGEDLGWQPSMSVQEGVDDMIGWMKGNKKVIENVLN